MRGTAEAEQRREIQKSNIRRAEARNSKIKQKKNPEIQTDRKYI